MSYKTLSITLSAIVGLFTLSVMAHVSVIALTEMASPISTHYLSQSEISKAVYSDLSGAGDHLILHTTFKSSEITSFEVLTPVCENISRYEFFQPTLLVLKNEAPWKNQGETNLQYIIRLKAKAVLILETNFNAGERPQFFEEYSKQSYWVGAKWKGQLEPGLYSLIAFDPEERSGTFTIGINEKESWTPDLFKYADQVTAKLAKGLCDSKGLSGRISEGD